MEIDEAPLDDGEMCPSCGEGVIDLDADGQYVCPVCGSSFDREEIEEYVDLEDDHDH